MSGVRIVDAAFLEAMSEAARGLPRLRKNFNFHANEADGCNRLLNAVEPGSYVRPHRHLDPGKDETFVVVRGRFGFAAFDEAGKVTRAAVVAAGTGCCVVDVPHGTYHTLVALAPGSVFFEAKGGPFVPLAQDELAPWAPAEKSEAAAAYRVGLERLFGDC
jgi:cupin fold WbuC family metalloprotein